MIEKDEIQEKVDETVTGIRRWGNAFVSAYIQLMPFSLILTVAVLGGLFFAWLTWHSMSEIEKEAEDSRTNTILIDANSNVYANRVKETADRVESTEKTSRNAQKQAEKARQKPKANVNISEAMENCEKVYPGECK